MTRFTIGLSMAGLLALAACNNPPPPAPMAPAGATGGVAVQAPLRPDTGNMALPPRAQGNSAPGRY